MHSRRLYVTLLVWLVAGCWLVRCVYRSIQIGLHCSFDVCTCWFAMTKLPSSSANRTKESNVRICARATEPATSKTIYSQLQKFQLDRNGKKTTTKKRHRVRLLCFCFSVGCFFFVSPACLSAISNGMRALSSMLHWASLVCLYLLLIANDLTRYSRHTHIICKAIPR